MTYVLPPIAMWAVYIAGAVFVVGFFAGITGLLLAIPHIVSGGGQTFGERAYRANQRHGDFYSKTEFKRERRLVFGGFGTAYFSFAFIFFLMLTFGQPVVN